MNRKSVIRVVLFAAATVVAGSGGTKSLLAAPKDGQDGDHGRRLRVTKGCSIATSSSTRAAATGPSAAARWICRPALGCARSRTALETWRAFTLVRGLHRPPTA